jgi:hypothetical protein
MALVVGGEDEEPVIFDEEEGQPFVQVVLEPSKVPALCRVSSTCAGNGEGEWNPFLAGDEVVVLIPEGREDSGCVIVGRLNNQLDKFPMESVAGQDPTTNAFAMRRRRTPFVEEVAGPILFRSALNEGFISLDEGGVFTVRGTDGVSMQMGPDAFQFQGPQSPVESPEYILQMDMQGEHFLVQIKDAILSLGSSTSDPEQNTLTVPGPLTIGTLANPTAEHVVTTEALGNILVQLGLAATSPWTSAQVAAAILAATTTPVTPDVAAEIAASFAAATQKPLVDPATNVQLQPGIGCPGLVVG